MTQKELLAEIKRCEEKIIDLENYRKNIPGFAEAEKKLQNQKYDYLNSIENERLEIREWIRNYNRQISELKKKNELIIPDEIVKWFREYGSGVNFGYNGIKIVWISKDKRWVIITNKGGTAGTGTAMGTASYYYAVTEHWLACVDKGRYLDRPTNCFGRIEGRLTKELKNKLINSIPEFEKELNKKE